MKWILLVLLPIFSYAQQDSTFYEKRDTQWYRITVRIEGQKKTITEEPYTTIDSLIKSTLLNTLVDAGRQYRAFKISLRNKRKITY